MFKHPLLLISCIVFLQSTAQLKPDQLATIHEHRYEVNKEWSNYTGDTGAQEYVHFQNEEERIKDHLLNVVQILKAREAQNQKRITLLDSLKAYAIAEQFPKNSFHSTRQPYFVDQEGTACAVGHMMRVSGHHSLVERISREHNYDYMKDIRTPGTELWAEEFGFELEELAWIQPAYCPVLSLQPVDHTLDGGVNLMLADEENERMYLFGEFTQLSPGVPCEGLAYMQNEIFHCITPPQYEHIHSLGLGPDDELFMTGRLINDGQTSPFAIRVDGEWSYESIPQRLSAQGIEALFTTGPNPELILVVSPDPSAEIQEIWHKESDATWTLMATINGQIFCSHSAGYQIFGGEFDSYIDHLSNDSSVQTNGLIFTHFYPISEYFMTGLLHDSLPHYIHSISGDLNAMTVTGHDSGDAGDQGIFVSRILADEVIHFFSWDEASQPFDIRFLQHEVMSDDEIIVLSDPSAITFEEITHGPAVLREVEGDMYLNGLAHLDSFPQGIEKLGNSLYIYGHFTQNCHYAFNTQDSLFYLARYAVVSGIDEWNSDALHLYPNPTDGRVNLDINSSLDKIFIYNPMGEMLAQIPNDTRDIDLSAYADGVYLLVVESDGRRSNKVILKHE